MTAYTRLRAPLLALLVAVLSTACSGTSSTEPDRLAAGDGLAGRYVLQQVNGEPLPYAFYEVEQPGDFEGGTILDGVLVLNEEGTYARSVTIRFVLGAGADIENTFTDQGTYAVRGDRLVLHPEGGSPLNAVVAPGQVTVQFSHSEDGVPELTYTFRR